MKDYVETPSYNKSDTDLPMTGDENIETSGFDHGIKYIQEDHIPVYQKKSPGSHISTLDGQILDWDDTTVKIDVLVNKELKEFQNRRFPKILFENTELLKQRSIVRIMMYAKRGSMEIKFIDGNALVDKNLFEEDIDLSTLKSKIFEFEK